MCKLLYRVVCFLSVSCILVNTAWGNENNSAVEASNTENERLPAKVTSEIYVINNEIFTKSADRLREIFYSDTEETEILFVPESDMMEAEVIMRELPDTLLAPMMVQENHMGYCIFNFDIDDGTHVFNWDIESQILESVGLDFEVGMNVVSCTTSSEYIYWVESDEDYSQKDPDWILKRYEISTGEEEELDNSDNYGRISLLPRVTVFGDKMTYIVGEEADGEYSHYVRLYSEADGSNNIIFNIQNLKSAYTVPFLDRNVIAAAEYFKDGWYLLQYDLEDGTVTKDKIEFLTEGEFPQTYACIGDTIVYRSSLNVLYAITDDEVKVVSTDGGGIDRSAVYENNCIYIDRGRLWVYNVEIEEKEMIYENKDYFLSAVLQNDKKVFVILHHLKDASYCMLEVKVQTLK